MAFEAVSTGIKLHRSRQTIQALISNLEQLNNSIVDSLIELRTLEKSISNPDVENREDQSHEAFTNGNFRGNVQVNLSYLFNLREKLVDSAEHVAQVENILAARNATIHDTNGGHKMYKKLDVLRLPLENEEYERYGRQLIMPEIGAEGQMRLKKASVLIIGLGGLGCPAAVYLAGAGVGTLGLVDGDTVERSNLHRQILHSSASVGSYKVDSAIRCLGRLNSHVKYIPYRSHLSTDNVLPIFDDYDLILDCTDQPASRYLISDAAILCSKPLVSAAALRTDGQLMVLNYPTASQGDASGGPCYRCIFPKPPPAESVISCGEGGILGPVVGVMGVLQALEAIKVLVQANNPPQSKPSLLMYSAFNTQPFRTVKLRGRKVDCPACSDEAKISKESLFSGSMDYVQFCGVTEPVQVRRREERISTKNFAQELQKSKESSHSPLIDVRDKTQFELCSVPGSINIPYSTIMSWKYVDDIDSRLVDFKKQDKLVTFVCRYGNDSQLAVKKLEDLGLWREKSHLIRDIQGGWKSWKQDVDVEWPDY